MNKFEFIKNRKDYSKLIEVYVAFIYSLYIKKGDVVIDAGVNWGMHFYPLANLVGETGKVIGFEANPKLAKHVNEIVKKKGLIQCELKSCALYDQPGIITFLIYPNQLGLSHIEHDGPLHPYANDIDVEKVEVPSIQLDNFKYLPVKFIKSDLEGADFRALRGGEYLIKNSNPLIIFETLLHLNSKQHHFTVQEFFDFFDAVEYDLFDIHGSAITRSDVGESDHTVYSELLAVSRKTDLASTIKMLTQYFWSKVLNLEEISDWAIPPKLGKALAEEFDRVAQ